MESDLSYSERFSFNLLLYIVPAAPPFSEIVKWLALSLFPLSPFQVTFVLPGVIETRVKFLFQLAVSFKVDLFPPRHTS